MICDQFMSTALGLAHEFLLESRGSSYVGSGLDQAGDDTSALG